MAFNDELEKIRAIAYAFQNATGQTVREGIATTPNSNPVTSVKAAKALAVQAPTSAFSKAIKQFTSGSTVTMPPVKTAQQTLQFQPVQQKNWYKGSVPTASEMLAQITRIGRQDYAKGQEMFNLFGQLQSDKSSPFYAPYSKPTNLALNELTALGFDVSNGVDDKFFQENAYLKNYYRESSASGGALAPTKKSSWEEKAAYWYNQLLKDDENTKKAENEWAALQEEISYWTSREDRNYSDEEILKKINWNNYKTLTKMDEAAGSGSPMMLNRAIGYSQDALKGVIWAARNGSTGNALYDSAMAELGEGKSWHENADIRAKLDVKNKETYSPYSVGSTLEDAALYFGVSDFGPDWLANNRNLLASDNDTDRKMYGKVYDAEQNTLKAEAELKELHENMDRILSYDKISPETAIKMLQDELDGFSTLKKMDVSRDSGDLMSTTRAVDYRWEDIEAEMRKRIEERDARRNSAVTLKQANDRLQGKESILHDPAEQAGKDAAIGNAAPVIMENGTPAEQKVFKHAGASGFAGFVQTMAQLIMNGNADPQTVYDTEKKQTMEYAAEHYFDSRKTIEDYENAQKEAEDAQNTLDSILQSLPGGSSSRVGILGLSASTGPQERPMLSTTASTSTPPEEDSDDGKALMFWMTQNRDKVQEINAQADWDDDKAWAMCWDAYQQEKNPEADPQQAYIDSLDPETRAAYYQAQKTLDEANATMEKLQGSYEEAQAHMEEIGNRQDIAAKMGIVNGAEMGKDAIQAMNDLYEIGKEYKPTVFSTESIFEAMPEKERIPAAKAAVEQYTAQLKQIQEALEALDGVQFSESANDIFNNVQRERERLERELKAAQHYAMMDEADFDKTAKAGLEALQEDMANTTILDERTRKPLDLQAIVDPIYWAISKANGGRIDLMSGGDNTKISLMTEDEKRIFYSLYNRNPDEAIEWFEYLANDTYGVLTNRMAGEQTKQDETFAKDFPLLANVTSILSSPGRMAGGLYGFWQLLTGQDVNPNSAWYTLSRQSNTVKSVSKQGITDYFGENTLGAKLGNLGYDVFTSMGESTMNTLTFGGLVPGADSGLGVILSNFLSAAPMGLSAAGDAISEAVANGADPHQAVAIGAVTLLAEAGTEAITVGNMKAAFGRGELDTAGGFRAFIADMFKDMGEEAAGEMINEAVESMADDAIMGELSKRQERIAYYMSAEGGAHSPSEAEDLANREVVHNVLYAGLTGALSGGLTTGGSYVAGQVASGVTTRQETARISRNNMAILEESMAADTASQTEALAAVLASDGNMDASTAAAVEMAEDLGNEKAIKTMKHIEAVAAEAGMSLEQVHGAVRTAATGKGSAYNALVDIADHGATTQKVNNLVEAAAEDITQAETQERMQQTEADVRAAQKVRDLAAEGAFESVFASQQEEQKARAKQRVAEKELDRQRKKAEQLGDAFMATQDLYLQDPTNIKAEGAMTQALNDMDGQNEVVKEYEQSLQNAQESTAMAERKRKRESEKALAIAREQANQEIAAEQQAAEEAAAQAEETERQAAIAKQAEEDVRTGKSEDEAVSILAQETAAKNGMDEEQAAAFQRRMENRFAQLKAGTADLSQSVTGEEAAKLLGRMARKIGVDIRVSDMSVGRGKYKNGVITLSNKLTVGQAMVEAALHEVTHAVEQTKAYQAYSDFVMNLKYKTSEALQAAVDQKIAEYGKSGVELTEEGARQELVADFARTELSKRDTVYRLVERGFGGTIRNALHNVNQYLKNMRLTGQERIDAENLRKAERLFKKALNQQKQTETHPTATQFSIPQMAQAMGLSFDENTLQLYDPNTGGVVENVTPDMLNNTPIGLLIDAAANGTNAKGKAVFTPTISPETAAAQKQMFADLMSMCAKYKDSDLVWEIASSTLSSQFSALKSNSDPQYGTTIDFGTVCAKTQEIVNVLSQTMLEKGRGLTRDEIMTVYNETYNAGLTVPCPVCYVFSRWMGVPSLLGQMKTYQDTYVAHGQDGSIDIPVTQKIVDEYIENAKKKYGTPKDINKKKATFENQLKQLEQEREQYIRQLEQIKRGEINDLSAEAVQQKLDATVKKMTETDQQLGEVSAYNWITQALCNEENGKYVVDPDFRVVPDEILFDLNRTGEFAKYQKSWRYRNTRGAGMGKAILPYSGEAIGDIVHGTSRWSADQNPFLNMNADSSTAAMRNAQRRAKTQNLVGGQRLQSTSDFRPEWGLDYMMSFLELQAIGSKAQLYTKVAEAVDLLASVGADVNLSIMGKGTGWHQDENGQYVLDFSDVTGMPYETAKGLKDKYDNVQMILVGMNDTHIRLAMADSDIDFIIPWHSSGNSKDTLATLVGSVGETLETSSDYTDSQTDKPKADRTAEQKARWDARVKMLMGKDLTLEERTLIYSDPYLKPLYDRFYVEGVDPDCYGVKMPKSQAEQIFPYEYWVTDPSQPGGTKATADVNGQRFVEYCESMGLEPRFSQFKDDPGYWKLLIDRSMYDLNGNYRAQQVIDVTNAQIGQLEDGHLTNSQLPLETSAKYGSRYSDQERQAVENSLAAIDAKYDVEGSFSIGGDITDADIDQAIADREALTDTGVYPSSAEDGVKEFSIGGDITDADIDQMLTNAGLITTSGPSASATTNQLATQSSMPTQSMPTGGEQRQRQFGSKTAQRSNALHEDVKQYLREHSGYNADSNQAQIDRSITWVQEHATEADPDGYFAALDEVLDPNFNYMSADGQARMLTVMSMAALKGDVASETRIADAYNQQGTAIGRTLQARNIFNMMTPLGRISTLRHQENRINQEYIAKGKPTRVHLSEETLRLAGEARTAEDFLAVQDRAHKELAQQMPASWQEKLRGIRYFSMLFNPVTHIRNIVGNAGFMPAVSMKNAIGTVLERTFAKGSEQTKAIRASKENRAFAKADAVAMKDVLTGEAKYNSADPVEQERKFFGKGFQALVDFNSNLLEAEDWAFLRRHYANALSGWMQANNMTPAMMQSDTAMLDRARAYAIDEAQKATYRDASKFASMMSNISRQGGVGGFLVDAALPFKKTPTNILKRGVEYSPAGLLKTLLADTGKLLKYNQWANSGQDVAMPTKAISPTQYIDRIASGLSGTAVSALGALMSAMGWLTLGHDGDDDEIAKQNGEQDYSLRLKLFGQDISYTIDWLAPSSMPLFVGASIYNEVMREHNSEDALDVAADVADAFLRMTEPVFNLSMLDGVNSLLQTSSWSDTGNNITDIGATLLSNYATSFMPTVLGKVAKTVDTTRRETFVESGTSKTKALLERTWQKTLAKVPGASSLLKPYVSPLGEEEKADTVAAVLQNFVSPGYFKTVEISELEQELQRLYDATGDTSVIPKQPAKHYTAGGEKVTLDAKEYTEYQKNRGALLKDLLGRVINSPEYQIYGDDAKVKMIADATTYCSQVAKSNLSHGGTMDKWVAEAQKKGDPLKALIARREDAVKAEYVSDHRTELLKAVEEEDLDSVLANAEALVRSGKKMSEIRGYVSNVYRPQYQEAIENDDPETAYGILNLLMSLGLGYKKDTIKGWGKNSKNE